MTLLETLAALAIFALACFALYPVISGALNSRARATERFAAAAEARAILDRIEQDIVGNCETGFQGPLPPRFVAVTDTLRRDRGARRLLEATTLVARGVTPSDAFVLGEDVAALSADRGDQAQILWRIDEDGRLLRHEIRPPTTEVVDWTNTPAEVVSERADLLLEFYEPENWIESWDSSETGPHRGRAPQAVRTTLRIADEEATGDAPLELVSTVVLPVVDRLIDPRLRRGTQP